MPAAALLGGVGRAGMHNLQLPGEEGANTFFRETGTKQARINSSSHSKNTRRTSTVVLEYPWHRYGMALCFFLVLVRVVVLIPGMFNSLCDVFYLLFEGFLVYQSLSSKIPPYDSENPGYLRVSSLVQAGTPNSTPQTPHRGYLLPEAMIGQFRPQELSLSCGGRRESEHRRR